LREEEAVVFVLSMIILAGVGLMVAAMMNRRRIREMEHRERLAMIDRGLIPSPESDPGGFEAGARFAPENGDAGIRYRTAGILMIGFGLGLMILLTFAAGSPAAGIGIGGGWAVLGGASLLNYSLMSRHEQERSRSQQWRPPVARRPDPPASGAP
jgi:Flp pilus assembly protein TadB